MAATPITAAQAACLHTAGMRALETARRLLVAAEQQVFNLEEGLTLLCEAMGAVAVAFPKADVARLIPRAVMGADFGMLTPDEAKRKAGWQ